MNIILFEEIELNSKLSRKDPRAQHILKVLKLGCGDKFRSGVLSGFEGHSYVHAIGNDSIELKHIHNIAPQKPDPIHLVCGLPRPNSVKRILRDGTSLGVNSFTFIQSDLGEKSYRTASIWQSHKTRDLMIQGASQAYHCHIPSISHLRSLDEAIAQYQESSELVVFDHQKESSLAMTALPLLKLKDVTCFIGPERGWSQRERDLLESHKISTYHLGSRVLRADTAFISAISILRLQMGLNDSL